MSDIPDRRSLLSSDRPRSRHGPLIRAQVLKTLLQAHPEWREKVRLIQVAVPSRDNVGAYRRFKREVEAAVGRINGEFATPNPFLPVEGDWYVGLLHGDSRTRCG